MEDELIQDAVRSGARLAKRTANETAGRKVARRWPCTSSHVDVKNSVVKNRILVRGCRPRGFRTSVDRSERELLITLTRSISEQPLFERLVQSPMCPMALAV